jgi:Terminase large subunit, T4likevirus-type, N-terminal
VKAPTPPEEEREAPRNDRPTAAVPTLRLLRATCNPAFFAREFLRFSPDSAQARVLELSIHTRRIALNCNRQWGKSTIAAILAVHRLFTRPGVTVLIVAPSGRQSGETLRKVAGFLNVLDIPLRRDGVNRHSLALPNGSRIVSLPAVDSTVRGFSAVSMLIVDEASRVPDEVYLALRPALAVSQGDIVLVSTPNGRRGFFYREMTGSDNDARWLRHTGPVSDCGPRVPQEFIEEEKARGDSYFRQEYLCEFVETGKYLFDEALLHQIVKRELEAYAWV